MEKKHHQTYHIEPPTTTWGMLPLFYELIFETVYGFLRDDVAATTANLTMRPGWKALKFCLT